MARALPPKKKQLQEDYQNGSCAAEEEDRISKLPDELIHVIFSFMKDTKFAVQTCILSTRWKNVWTTLPNLILNGYNFGAKFKFSKFVDHIFSCRNHASQISTINITSDRVIDPPNFKSMLNYAFAHGIQHLKIINICNRRSPFPIPISTFNSESLKCLHLSLTYWHIFEIFPSPPSRWNLPNLTSLYLDRIQFKLSSNSTHKSADLFSNLVNLKDLSLIGFRTPDFDALNIISLTLQHLTICPLYFDFNYMPTHKTPMCVSTPNLTSFTYRGALPVLSATEPLVSLTEATIELPYWRDEKHVEPMHKLLSLLRNTMFLTLSSGAVRILAGAPELLENRVSPLCKLKFLTIAEDNNPPAISNDVRTYLLNSSPNAIIDTISRSGRRTKLQNCPL